MSTEGQRNTLRYASLATQWMVMLLIAVFVGHKIDKWLEWKIPVCTIVFPLVLLVISFWKLMQEFTKPKK